MQSQKYLPFISEKSQCHPVIVPFRCRILRRIHSEPRQPANQVVEKRLHCQTEQQQKASLLSKLVRIAGLCFRWLSNNDESVRCERRTSQFPDETKLFDDLTQTLQKLQGLKKALVYVRLQMVELSYQYDRSIETIEVALNELEKHRSETAQSERTA